MEEEGITVRRALPPEKYLVTGWIKDNFSPAWASEGEVAFSNQPVSCFIATRDKELLGFACYESTCKGFFGPTGVIEDWQGRGIGTALLSEQPECHERDGLCLISSLVGQGR